MQNSLYFRLSFILILFIGSLISLSVLAATGNWFLVGEAGYPLQRAGEQMLTPLKGESTEQVDWLTILLVRRCEQFIRQPEASLLREIETSLDHAAAAFSRLEKGGVQQESLRSAAAMCELGLEQNPALKAAPRAGILESKLHSLRLVLNSPNARPEDALDVINLLLAAPSLPNAQPASTQAAQVDPRLVTFPANSPAALHTFYPLTGRHTGLSCNNCHPTGNYAGTPGLCLDCHLDEAPEDHYSLNCTACHNTEAWEQVSFDHREVQANSCESCHQAERPTPHYAGPCAACHTPTDWRQVNFNHSTAGATDCAACHTDRKPANHYGGQCSLCHSTSAWEPATFNHAAAGATDCVACHTDRKPANHFDGQCSLCHSTSAWEPATFNHAAAGATDCAACHLGNRPDNHYDGQCSTCHNTESWENASYPHTFPTNHEGANNQCAKCHPVSTDTWTCYVCHDQGKMEEEHKDENITNLGSRCLECHPDGKD